MEDATRQSLLRALPSIDEVLTYLEAHGLLKDSPRFLVVACVRKAVDDTRAEILDGTLASAGLEAIALRFSKHVEAFSDPSLRRVINATGIIIHTNLGRSVLAREALAAVQDVAGSYSTLEYDTGSLTRGSRQSHYEKLLCLLTGAEAALAVNNNAAAVLLVLSAFAEGREAIVSRGELVEIGGSFRIPDIMRLSHAEMVEVGTTNKTHVHDYQNAVSRNTSLLLKVHRSNFKMVGFTEEVSVSDLRLLADREMESRAAVGIMSACDPTAPDELLVYEDQGSGVLMDIGDLTKNESTVSESLDAGADLVSFSGDKLFGGPQAGIIVGRKPFVDRLKQSPLARALRLDKLTLATLEATLRIYLDKDKAALEIPTLRMLTLLPEEVQQLAQRLCALLDENIESGHARFSVVEEKAQAGGGALPQNEISSYAVCVEFLRGSALECERFLQTQWSTPIICRIKKEQILCDPRTLVHAHEMDEVTQAFKAYFAAIA